MVFSGPTLQEGLVLSEPALLSFHEILLARGPAVSVPKTDLYASISEAGIPYENRKSTSRVLVHGDAPKGGYDVYS